MIFTLLFMLILLVLVYNYYVHYISKKKLINLIPGPAGYPTFGNIFQYLDSREEIWKIFNIQSNQYYPIFKLWAFSIPIIFIRHPDDIKIILSNIKHSKRSFFYNGIRPWFGDNNSVFTTEDTKWQMRRKMLIPTFHFNILQQFVPILIEEGENMIKSYKNTQSTVVKDLLLLMSEHTLNAICETSMGTSLRDLGSFQQKYLKAVHQINEIFVYRLTRQWLQNDWLFSLTSKSKEQKKILKLLHGFTNQIIAERKQYHERTNDRYLKSFDNNMLAKVNDAEVIERKKLALLDLLIATSRDGILTGSDIEGEINGFLFAGHDTTATTLTYLLMQLAEHKDIQDRVRNEVDTVMKENKGKFTTKSLECLSYLEMCMKETMRLYPPGFLMSRVAGEDVKLQSYVVPAGTTLMLNCYALHRDLNFWPNPEKFDPERFLPERIQNRHPYCYVSFSAGARNCIGQRYALMQMKALIVPLIHNFYLEPIDYLKNIRLHADMVLRPAHPLSIKFIPISKINGNA